jgi:uncharacterized protein (DUF1697 family)
MATTRYTALVRGINVGGSKLVAMADLRHLLTRLGLADAQSLLQSGNLLFTSAARPRPALERLLEAEAERRLGLRTAFFVRTAEEWRRIISRNPFPEQAARDPARLVVMLFKDAVKPAGVDALRAAIAGPEILHAQGTEAYVVYPNGQGRSKLTNALIERTLGASCTGRNWNTVQKLAAQLVSEL